MKGKFKDKTLAQFAIDFVVANLLEKHLNINNLAIVVGNSNGDILAVRSFEINEEYDIIAMDRFKSAVETGKITEKKDDLIYTPALIEKDVVVACCLGELCYDQIFTNYTMKVIQVNLELSQDW